MEGRLPPRLYLELVRFPDHVNTRAAAVEATGWQVSTWEPATTSDDDLPRRLPRCDGVVIGEGDGGAVESPSPATTAVPLVSYPRPSQGSCSASGPRESCWFSSRRSNKSGLRNSRDWGDFVHLRHIAEAAVPGYRTITPWENESSGTPRFCHMYEMVGDGSPGHLRKMTPRVRQRLDRDDLRRVGVASSILIEESRTYRRREPKLSRPGLARAAALAPLITRTRVDSGKPEWG